MAAPLPYFVCRHTLWQSPLPYFVSPHTLWGIHYLTWPLLVIVKFVHCICPMICPVICPISTNTQISVSCELFNVRLYKMFLSCYPDIQSHKSVCTGIFRKFPQLYCLLQDMDSVQNAVHSLSGRITHCMQT